MKIQIGKYVIKTLDNRNLVIIEQRPAGKNPKTGEIGTGVKEVTVGYYPNLEWALHMMQLRVATCRSLTCTTRPLSPSGVISRSRLILALWK